MWRAQTRPRASHQHTIANDSPPNLGLTWILYPAQTNQHNLNSQFRISHLFLAVSVVAVFLALRAWWLASENDKVIVWSTISMVILVSSIVAWADCRNLPILFVSGSTALISSGLFAMECVFHSPASEFVRDRISTMYYDEPTLNLVGVFIATFVLTPCGAVWGIALRQMKPRILKYRLEITLAVSCGILFGVFACGSNVFWALQINGLSAFLGGFTVGSILGSAFGITRYKNRLVIDSESA